MISHQGKANAKQQNRYDRDDYIEMREENVRDGWLSQFRIAGANAAMDVGTYDYLSVMHYSDTSTSRNGQPVYVARPQYEAECAQLTCASSSRTGCRCIATSPGLSQRKSNANLM